MATNIARKLLDAFVANDTDETFTAWVDVDKMDQISFIIEAAETLTSVIDAIEVQTSPESAEKLNDGTLTPAFTGPIIPALGVELQADGVRQAFLLDTVSASVGPTQLDVPRASAIRSLRLRVKMTTADATNFFTITAWLIAKQIGVSR